MTHEDTDVVRLIHWALDMGFEVEDGRYGKSLRIAKGNVLVHLYHRNNVLTGWINMRDATVHGAHTSLKRFLRAAC